MSVGAFREELDSMVVDVVKRIKDLHKTNDTVEIPREGLLEYMRLKILPDVYIIKPTPINVAAGFGPMFLKLPREIRDMIFGPVIASGHTQLLRASRALNEEGMVLVSQHGICRINIGFREATGFTQPMQRTVDTIQNLRVRVNTRYYLTDNYKNSPGYQLLEMFARGKLPSQRTCSVVFETYPQKCRVDFEVLSLLTILERFDKVTLRIEVDSAIDVPLLDDFRYWYAMREGYISLDKACKDMEPTMGAAYQENNAEGMHMVFYPPYASGKEEGPSLEKKVE